MDEHCEFERGFRPDAADQDASNVRPIDRCAALFLDIDSAFHIAQAISVDGDAIAVRVQIVVMRLHGRSPLSIGPWLPCAAQNQNLL